MRPLRFKRYRSCKLDGKVETDRASGNMEKLRKFIGVQSDVFLRTLNLSREAVWDR
jgi:hypothetical protein